MFTFFDALDIALVTILIYQAYRLVVNSRTLNLLRGLLVFGLLLYVSRLLGLATITPANSASFGMSATRSGPRYPTASWNTNHFMV